MTENAYKFLRAQRAAGNGRRVFLAKGLGGLERDRAKYGAPEKILQQKRGLRSDIKLVYVGTDKLKDEVTLALTRQEPGPGAYHLSRNLDDRVFAEFCAEVRTSTGWEKRKHGLANEALDLGCYDKALVIVLKGERIDWQKPPAWAAPMPQNLHANVAAPNLAAPASPKPAAAPSTDPKPAPKRRATSGFVSRRY